MMFMLVACTAQLKSMLNKQHVEKYVDGKFLAERIKADARIELLGGKYFGRLVVGGKTAEIKLSCDKWAGWAKY